MFGTVFGIVIGVVGVVVSIVFGILSLHNRTLRYWQVETESLFTEKLNEIGKVKIEYDNEEITDKVIMLKTVIENNGKQDIDQSIVYEPITIQFPEFIQILDVEILNAPRGVELIRDEKSIKCKWELLKRKEFIVIKLLLKINKEKEDKITPEDLLKKYTKISYRVTDVNKVKKINYIKPLTKKLTKSDIYLYTSLALFYIITMLVTLSLDFWEIRYENPLVSEQFYSVKGKSENTIEVKSGSEKRILSVNDFNDKQKETRVVLVKSKVTIFTLLYIIVMGVVLAIPSILSINEYKIDKRVHTFIEKPSDKEE